MPKKAMEAPSQEKEYGQAQVDEAMRQQTERMPDKRGVVQGAPVAPDGQQPVLGQQPESYTVQNPYMLLPPTINFQPPQLPRLTESERRYNLGLFWQALASSPGSPPLTQALAQYFVGEKKNG